MLPGGWKSDVAAFAGGLLLPFAFAPFGWWPLALVSLLSFHYLIHQDQLKRALWRAFLYGLGYFGIGISWVYVSISLFGNASPPLAASITLMLIVVMSCYMMLAAFLARKCQAGGVPGILALPAAWILVEWLRDWLFTGFGWLSIGYAFIDTPIAAYAPFIGVLGIGFLVLLSVTGLYLLLHPARTMGLRAFGLLLVLSVWLPPLFLQLPHDVQYLQQKLDVALLQGNIPQHRKWLPEERQPTLDWYRRTTEAHWDRDIVVWPETAIPAYEDQVFDFLETMSSAAQVTSTRIITGVPVRESHGARYYNALVVLGDGHRGAETIYLKRHLVPFGEYLPMKALLDPVLGFLRIPMSNFSPGDAEKPLVSVGEHQAGVFICFEIAFAADVREAFPQAAYLINISNDAWFGDSLAPAQHLQMARMRAKETGRYLLRATNTGITAIIEPDGSLQKSIPQFEPGVLTGTIAPATGQTVYARIGDLPLLILLVLSLAGLWGMARRKGADR